MSVRWKPLIVLSGLFVTVALGGLAAFVLVSGQSNIDDVLAQARTAREAGKFDESEIYYLQANQFDSKRAEVHEELADLYGEWVAKADPAKRDHYQGLRLRHLFEAAKYDKTALAPRLALLSESLKGNDPQEQNHWARQVIVLDPLDADALFVLAIAALAETPANLTEAGRLLESLEKVAPDRDRTSWVAASIALKTEDTGGYTAIIRDALKRTPDPQAVEVDRLSRLYLLVSALDSPLGEEQGPDLIAKILDQTAEVLERNRFGRGRIVELQHVARQVRNRLLVLDTDSAEERWEPLAEAIDRGFLAAIEAEESVDLYIHQAYAEHLNIRGRRDACLKVIDAALTPEVLKDSSYQAEVFQLRKTAIQASLSDGEDANRFELARPHIEALIASSRPDYQGIGHLFQGAIELEMAGFNGPRPSGGDARSAQSLASARNHLRDSAKKLPDAALPKALYGISLLMSGESALGRQHLLEAQRAGPLEARYQVWAAWSLLEAGYPEESSRIVDKLMEVVDSEPSVKALAGSLRLIEGEIARNRKTPVDLEVARTAYTESIVDGEDAPPAVSLRLVELTIDLDGPEAGLKQLDEIRQRGGMTPTLEALAVSTLVQLDRDEEAISTLKAARDSSPNDPQLAVLDAAIALKQERPEDADALLAEYLEANPDELTVAQTRARILSGELDRQDEAKTLLAEAGERSGVTAPFVQLAMLDIDSGDLTGAAKTIETIRTRWPEASAGDLLDAQIAMVRRDHSAASKHLSTALEKDPSNKVARFWKAYLDSRNGAPGRAAEDFERILQDRPTKDIGNGLSLSTAAEWSLASLAMENKDFENAIARLESIVEGTPAGSMERAARWQIIAARTDNGQWPEARKELIELLNEPESTVDERVQAADFFRRNDEVKIAETLIDQVLDRKPGHSGAVIIKSYLLSEQGRTADAVNRLKAAIDLEEQPPAVYLMLAAFAGEADGSDGAVATIRTTLEEGLEAHPTSVELLRSIYEIIRKADGIDAAIAYVEQRAEADDSEDDRVKRLLVDIYTQAGRLDEAQTLVESLIEHHPKNARLAAGLITIVSSKAIRAGREDHREDESALNASTLSSIQTFRERFPDDLRFPQAECELALRQADYARAEAVAKQIEELNPESPIGPLLLAQVYRDQGLDERAAQAYRDALDSNPLRDDIRIVLAQVLFDLGRVDEALAETGTVLDRSPDRPDAILLHAAMIASQNGTPEQVAARQDQAIALLRQTIDRDPSFTKGHLEVARINDLRGRTEEAIEGLRAARKASPDDEQLLSGLIRYLVADSALGSASGEENLAEALRIVSEIDEDEASGTLALALALGFHRGGRPDLARPWAEKASNLIDEPAIHLTHGDVLLALAESQQGQTDTRPIFEEAVAMYDRVLARDSRSVEAINNKGWILHHYLGKDQEALDLLEGLLSRVERRTLPGEFFDTLGSVQQSIGLEKDAEQTFTEGLRKSPELAVLNFHLGRLIAADPERSARANQYLSKAFEARTQLSLDDASELETLLDRVGH